MERPPVFYSHEALDVAIEDHPLAGTLPKATGGLSIQPGPPEFRVFAARMNAPVTLADFLNYDTPQLSLHITSFNDATLVALSWPHTLMDVMGQQALLRAWSSVLAGRESDVPPLLGARLDALSSAAGEKMQEETFKYASKQLRGWDLFIFGLRFAWNMMYYTVEEHTVYVPKSLMVELRHEAERDLAAADGGEDKLFVSDGDLLTAWAARAVASSLPQPRPVTVLHAINVRFRLSSLVQASGVYVQNMAVAALTFLSADVAAGPLGAIALENRRHLMEQATEGQVMALLSELRSQSKTSSDPRMLCGTSNAVLLPFTN